MVDIVMREMVRGDLPAVHELQLDPEANHMAAFTSKDPADLGAFYVHWTKILDDDGTINETVLVGDVVVGSVSTYPEDGHREVTYWIGREHWGRGIATAALGDFLGRHPARPVFARVAKDNVGSRRVLEKCGFVVYGEDSGFANARGEVVEEFLMRLETSGPSGSGA